MVMPTTTRLWQFLTGESPLANRLVLAALSLNLNNNVYLAARYNRLEYYKKNQKKKPHDRGKNNAELKQFSSTGQMLLCHRIGTWTQ